MSFLLFALRSFPGHYYGFQGIVVCKRYILTHCNKQH